MENILQSLGLTGREAKVYLLLLQHGSMTVSSLAEMAAETRSNAYLIVDALQKQQLVVREEGSKVRRYRAADPRQLSGIMKARMKMWQQTAAALTSVLPQLRSLYALTNDRPGVVQLAGDEGFIYLLDDMMKSSTEILLVASDEVPQDAETLNTFRRKLLQRKKSGITTRALFHKSKHNASYQKLFAERGIELRFIGEVPFKGELVIYEDSIAFTVYEPALIVTVITDANIAATMRSLFAELWQHAQE